VEVLLPEIASAVLNVETGVAEVAGGADVTTAAAELVSRGPSQCQ
jgi:hypothetical protein